jgi:hypothetical protein
MSDRCQTGPRYRSDRPQTGPGYRSDRPQTGPGTGPNQGPDRGLGVSRTPFRGTFWGSRWVSRDTGYRAKSTSGPRKYRPDGENVVPRAKSTQKNDFLALRAQKLPSGAQNPRWRFYLEKCGVQMHFFPPDPYFFGSGPRKVPLGSLFSSPDRLFSPRRAKKSFFTGFPGFQGYPWIRPPTHEKYPSGAQKYPSGTSKVPLR